MHLDKIIQHSHESPGRLALVARDAELDYGELRRQVDVVAAALASRGMGRGRVVAVCMERSAAAVVSLLGAMRCGAAFTVVEWGGNDAECLARLRGIAPDLVVARGGAAAQAAACGLRTVVYEDAVGGRSGAAVPHALPAPGDVAYVLYTSGSTGVPKGVQVTHANLRHYTRSMAGRLAIRRPLGYAHVSALSADLGNTGILLSLWTGGTLHVVDDDTRWDAGAFREYARSRGIGFLKITPSHFQALFPGLAEPRGGRAAFEYLVLGGEALPVGLARAILGSGIARVLVNHYGPTEATVGVAVHVLRGPGDLASVRGGTVPVGCPLGKTRLYVRTASGSFRSRDACGELYIGGPSVALGYFNAEDQTRERFVTGVEGDLRFYRTGDLCRVDGDGVVEFLGRVDRQVKINGHRVELEHVAAALRAHAGVQDAVAFLVERDTRPRLVAAYLAAGAVDEAGVVNDLRARVPGYMVPARLVRFEEFPLNPNGKVDVARLEAAVAGALARRDALPGHAGEPPGPGAGDPVRRHVREAWRMHLRHGRFGDETDFFAAGGDSITAIQVISELQVRGYRLTPARFLGHPTVRGLVEAIRDADAPPAGGHPAPLTESTEFSAAQRWFFRQRFEEPDHWNQALLLQSAASLDEETLGRALASVLALHPMLRCSFRRTEEGWRARTVGQPATPCLTVCRVVDGPAGLAAAVERASEALNQRIRLATGDVFKVCLLRVEHGGDHLLGVCHHLSVDAVSWRIIVDDLVRFYSAYARGITLDVPPSPEGFWEWVRHVNRARPMLEADLACWRRAGDPPAGQDAHAGANRERDASTVWMRFPADETEALSVRLPARADTQPHVALLGAFACAYGRAAGRDHLVVDVESHGRTSFDEGVDVSRVVGWFTSTFPVRLDLAGKGTHECIAAAGAALAAVPNLGVAYGELYGEPARKGLGPLRAEICYNYLGGFHIRQDDRLPLTVSRYPLAPARGPANDRVHDLKLTARTVNGELVVDLSFSRARHDVARMSRVLLATREALLREIGLAPRAEAGVVVDHRTGSGLLTYVPHALEPETAARRPRRYREVLLTGATGYLGVHVLHELLRQTDARIHCLVRGGDPDTARARLAEAYQHYLGPAAEPDPGRVAVVPGDVAEPMLGLSAGAFREMGMRLDAIYHFAADTRLFGPPERFERHNVDAVRWLIRLASSYRAKDLHHMSTLAVAGVNRSREPRVFSELCLDIGQDFQNEYERSKFRAEKLVFQFRAEGGPAYIYRSGNVSGRLDTAQFQRNAADNRLVQLLRAICKAGRLPGAVDERIALSPVDAVARAIVRISLEAGLAAGVFHVDTTHDVPFASLLEGLREMGFALESTGEKDFRTVFEELQGSHDPDLALGLFWTGRSSRNVVYVHENTHRLLDRMGCAIPPVDAGWLRRYLGGLVRSGVLKAGGGGVPDPA
ncbi:AMP-binding protein [Longimicrobium sp.]|uniref:AMP-binding protein n=1 Tax=Longimicrobium sp. TaxID=2029185 RepID=UPI002D1E2AB1|nr:AMP-binding protein [Longimicrobium sp.]HSU16594.1 AMP-binding protein [Longimicrobium sp.]